MSAERLLSSFAALLSSAMSDGQEHPSLSFSSKAMTLPRLISSYEYDLMTVMNEKPDNSSSNIERRQKNFSFPGLALKSSKSISSKSLNISPQESAALNLAIPINVQSSGISSIPITLLRNLKGSLQQLIDSRLRHSILALSSGKKNGIDGNADWILQSLMLRRILKTKNAVNIITVVTSFSVVSASSFHAPTNSSSTLTQAIFEKKRDMTDTSIITGNSHVNKDNSFDPSSSDDTSSLPIVFEVVIDMNILGKQHTISLKSQGTIQGKIHRNDNLLCSVNVALDTMGLLRDMMSQARCVAKNSMKRAVRIMTHLRDRQIVKEKLRSIISNKALNTKGNDALDDSLQRNYESNNENSESYRDNQAYPMNLLETVKHFSKHNDHGEDWSTEGFPPQLAATLKSLGPQDIMERISDPHGGEGGNGLHVHDFSSTPSSLSTNRHTLEQHVASEEDSRSDNMRQLEKPLHHELFAWMHNDDMVLKEEPAVQSDEEEDSGPMPSLLSSLKWDSFTQLAEGKNSSNDIGSKGVLRNRGRNLNHENSSKSLKKRKVVSFSFSRPN